jgi:transcriptional regulator with XRE-family HTH domain
MSDRRRGRPLTPLNPSASHAARLGAELRSCRLARDLTLQALGDLIGYTPQHISEVERAKATASQPFITACERALEADGALLALLPAVQRERAMKCDERSVARRYPALTHSEVGDEDVEPTNRRGLLGAGAGAALGAAGVVAVPAAAREIDPELPAHYAQLLSLLGRHDAAFGPHEVLAVVQRELSIIIANREVARGELRVKLLRIEARWTQFLSWLTSDAGEGGRRGALANRALGLAREGSDPDMAAYVLMRLSHWSNDARRATDLAQAGRRIATTDGVRALCAVKEARGHALGGDATACERALDAAVSCDAATNVDYGGLKVSPGYMRAEEARCWLQLDPRRAIRLYEDALRRWPRDRPRGRSIQRARLALACAGAGEHDRAQAEGRAAMTAARSTRSSIAARELQRLGQTLSTEA